MRYAIVALGLSAISVNALPSVYKRVAAAAVNDTQVLNYALTLEHLENAFYSGGLKKYDQAAFVAAGLPVWSRGRFEQIAAHEATHVAFLESALGDSATAACNYSFPYTDAKSFAALSSALEGVGVSAYTGAAQFITDKDYLRVAASILSTEARHASWVASAANHVGGWSGAFDVPLSLDQVYTLAAAFITDCPSSNPTLPVTAFPSLTYTPAKPFPGDNVTFTYNGTSNETLYATFFTGLGQEFSPLDNMTAMLPSNLTGTVYAVLSTNGSFADDSSIVAGPAILNFDTNSKGKVIS